MTTINEHGFSIELPGEWTADPEPEPGALVYRELEGDRVLTVMLLAVRPLFAIAERRRLLSDYVEHRATYEHGLMPDLEQYEEQINEADDGTIEAVWSGLDEKAGYRQHHRAVLYDDALVDVCIGGTAADARVFDIGALIIMASVKFAPKMPKTDA